MLYTALAPAESLDTVLNAEGGLISDVRTSGDVSLRWSGHPGSRRPSRGRAAEAPVPQPETFTTVTSNSPATKCSGLRSGISRIGRDFSTLNFVEQLRVGFFHRDRPIDATDHPGHCGGAESRQVEYDCWAW